MGDLTMCHRCRSELRRHTFELFQWKPGKKLLGRIYIEEKRDHRNANRFWLPIVKIIPVSTMAYTGTLVPKPAWRLRITVAERSYVYKLIEFYKTLDFGVEVSRS